MEVETITDATTATLAPVPDNDTVSNGADSAADGPTVPALGSEALLALVRRHLDDGKAEDIRAIDLAEKSTMADYMVIASGRSSRQVAALAEDLRDTLKAAGMTGIATEGLARGDWVLLDAGDVIVHLFRPEVRAFYNLEKMWAAPVGERPDPSEANATAEGPDPAP